MRLFVLVGPLLRHGLGHFHEARDVRARLQICVAKAVELAVLHAVVEDILHDALQLLVHFLSAPGQEGRVLRHLQAGDLFIFNLLNSVDKVFGL